MERAFKPANLLDYHDADAAILTFLPDIRWVCGFTGSNALVIITREEMHFITDGRYTSQSHREVKGASIHIAQGNLVHYAKRKGQLEGVRGVLIQADHLTVAAFDELKSTFDDVEWIPVPGLLEKQVARKNSREISYILDSQHVTEDVFTYLLDFIKAGMTEKEIAAELIYQHFRLGATAMSFDPIVASGPNGALPHARPSERVLQQGDMVVIDMGCFVHGYASDMTRTIAIGDPGSEARRVYDVVLEAQLRAIEGASAELTSRELDGMARAVITDAGFGDYFTHSLGHGVGLQIHEWPSVSWRTDIPLSEGMVITVEPGIYLPDNFGVRIEDMIQLTKTGSVNLTSSPKELIVL